MPGNRKVEKRLAARRKEIPSTGSYQTGAKSSFFRKPGSQNRKK